MKFRCAGTTDSFVDGLEFSPSLVVFFQGCRYQCRNCHNMTLLPFEDGEEANTDDIVGRLEAHEEFYKGLVLSGGNPMDQPEALYDLVSRTNIPTILYTGDLYEDIPLEILNNLNIIIDGQYAEDLRTGAFPASSNQRVFKNGEQIDYDFRQQDVI